MLRWFHPVVWIFLALAVFAWAGGRQPLGNFLALLAGVFYLIFIATFALDRIRR